MEHFLQSTPLFANCALPEVQALMRCLRIEQQHVKKGTILVHMGEPVTRVGIVIAGSVSVEYYDSWGNRSMINVLKPKALFAEMYALVPNEPAMVCITAAQDSLIAWLQIMPLFAHCQHGCGAERKVIQNLLTIAASRNLQLSQKIFHITPKSIRQRLLSYLSACAVKAGQNQFTIPYNRQQLADYLNVERSSLSHELSKMQRDGLITVNKNHFTLSV